MKQSEMANIQDEMKARFVQCSQESGWLPDFVAALLGLSDRGVVESRVVD